MPKTTFYNLPNDKKNNIIDKAQDIFIQNKYNDVNIRFIARELGISIGSFYQYFNDKDDLYLYLLVAIEKKIMSAQKENKGSLLSKDEYIPLSNIISEKEIAFNSTWYDIPLDVMRKFYFGEYCIELNKLVMADLIDYKASDKLKASMDVEFIFYIYTTMMFNVQSYFKQNNITDMNERIRLKRLFYNDIYLNGILNNNNDYIGGTVSSTL